MRKRGPSSAFRPLGTSHRAEYRGRTCEPPQRSTTSSCSTSDAAYQNAKRNSDKQNARIEHDKALARVMTAVLNDDTELFKQFMDNESFKRWMTDTVFGLTYEQPAAGDLIGAP